MTVRYVGGETTSHSPVTVRYVGGEASMTVRYVDGEATSHYGSLQCRW